MPIKIETANGSIVLSGIDGSGEASVTVPRSNVVGEAHTGNVAITGTVKGTYNQIYNTISGATVTMDCSSGNVFALTTSAATSVAFNNEPTSGVAYECKLILTAGGTHAITYPASVQWPNGAQPTDPASGQTDIITFMTVDGGTTWYGRLLGDNMS